MRLEVGKYYRSRWGSKRGPVEYRSYSNYFVASGWHYREDGSHLYGQSEQDLVAEWEDEMSYQVGDQVRILSGGYNQEGVRNGDVGYVTYTHFSGDVGVNGYFFFKREVERYVPEQTEGGKNAGTR